VTPLCSIPLLPIVLYPLAVSAVSDQVFAAGFIFSGYKPYSEGLGCWLEGCGLQDLLQPDLQALLCVQTEERPF
jgi:hypothetical protein